MTHNTALPHPRFRVPLIGDLVFVDVAKTCHRLVKVISTAPHRPVRWSGSR